MAQSGEFFNQWNFNGFVKRFEDINKVKVLLELTPKQREELFDIALLMRRQQKLESDAQSGSLDDGDLKDLEQVKSVIDKYCSLLEKIIKMKKENSSQI